VEIPHRPKAVPDSITKQEFWRCLQEWKRHWTQETLEEDNSNL